MVRFLMMVELNTPSLCARLEIIPSQSPMELSTSWLSTGFTAYTRSTSLNVTYSFSVVLDKPLVKSREIILLNHKDTMNGLLVNLTRYELPFEYSKVRNVWTSNSYYLLSNDNMIYYFKLVDGKVDGYKTFDHPHKCVYQYDSTFYFIVDDNIESFSCSVSSEGEITYTKS